MIIDQKTIDGLKSKYPLESAKYLGYHGYQLTVTGESINIIAFEYKVEGCYFLQLFVWRKSGIDWLDQIEFDPRTSWADVRKAAKKHIEHHFK